MESTEWLLHPLFPGRIGIWKCRFLWRDRGKPEYPEKNPQSRDEKQQQTQPTYNADTGNRTRATLVGGECSHHYAIPAPTFYLFSLSSFYPESVIVAKMLSLILLCNFITNVTLLAVFIPTLYIC